MQTDPAAHDDVIYVSDVIYVCDVPMNSHGPALCRSANAVMYESDVMYVG
jgi:hypothetical protein